MMMWWNDEIEVIGSFCCMVLLWPFEPLEWSLTIFLGHNTCIRVGLWRVGLWIGGGKCQRNGSWQHRGKCMRSEEVRKWQREEWIGIRSDRGATNGGEISLVLAITIGWNIKGVKERGMLT